MHAYVDMELQVVVENEPVVSLSVVSGHSLGIDEASGHISSDNDLRKAPGREGTIHSANVTALDRDGNLVAQPRPIERMRNLNVAERAWLDDGTVGPNHREESFVEAAIWSSAFGIAAFNIYLRWFKIHKIHSLCIWKLLGEALTLSILEGVLWQSICWQASSSGQNWKFHRKSFHWRIILRTKSAQSRCDGLLT